MKNKKRIFNYLLIFLTIIFIIVVASIDKKNTLTRRFYYIDGLFPSFNQNETINLDEIETYITFELEPEEDDIYVPRRMGYRYGPSIMYYGDGTMDAWFASNGSNGQWDWITYKHFNGIKWSDEQVILKPTKNSADHYSVCDPGVIFFNDYYYLGYTSTTNSKGINNDVFVARSKSPNGPFEKWNGDGWGGNPKPFITYDENDSGWGTGEVSFVVVDDKLYCYYSWINDEKSLTKLAIGDLSENWPSTIVDMGEVISKINAQDSCDVVFDEEYHKFIALCVESRFSDISCIAVYESDDGLSFKLVDRIKDNVSKYCHNMGISKLPNGHIRINENLVIGYAYSTGSTNIWGKWSTKFHNARAKVVYTKTEKE